MKRFIIVLMLVTLAVLPLVSAETTKVYNVGIAQFAVHGSLDNCREGFILGMKEHGFEEGINVVYNYQNANAAMDLAASVASVLVEGGSDLICAIATPMAAVAINTADDRIPVIYSAVSFPIGEGFAQENGLGTGNITGTSDRLPVRKQLEVIRAMLPEAKTIGILYTLSEANSVRQLSEYEELAGEFGFSIVSKGIAAGPDVALAVPALISQVDCMSMLLDNTVVQYLDVVLEQSDITGIPVFGSEVEQVIKGCVASQGLDYIALGKMTGELAARVLKGEDAATLPFVEIVDSELYINKEACDVLGITIPDDLLARAILTEGK